MCKIGVIDSGAGGVSTLATIMRLLPNHDYIYVSDRSHSPYGNKSGEFIFNRINAICRMLQGEGARAVVIACNTATAAGIEMLRAKFALQNFDESVCYKTKPSSKMIIVGVEPAIKPAVEELTCGKALVLLTPSAAAQPKFISLANRYGKDKLIISPQKKLATLIENNTQNLVAIKKDIKKMLSPLKTDSIESVVLGCTHYCLIKEQIADIFNAKVYDGNTGVAVRLYNLLKQNNLICRKVGGSIRFIRL